jgi:hypothetical protein
VQGHVKVRLAQPSAPDSLASMTKAVKSWWFALMLLPYTDSTSTDWTTIDPILALTGKDIYNHGQVRWYLHELATNLWEHTPPALIRTTILPTQNHYQTGLR